jgi:hypothetical protein
MDFRNNAKLKIKKPSPMPPTIRNCGQTAHMPLPIDDDLREADEVPRRQEIRQVLLPLRLAFDGRRTAFD